MGAQQTKAERRKSNIRLAIVLGVIAAGFYLGFIFLS